MRFLVVDSETAQPIPGVKVRAWVGANLVTDGAGSCSFALPKPTTADFSYRITISKDGYVPKYITWAKSRHDTIEDIPAAYTAKMEKAATIGGVLKGQDGQPIPGAKIIFSGLDASSAVEREKTTVAPNFHVERTDADGKWQCNIVPQKFQDMIFRVDQPDFLPALFGCEGSEQGGDVVTRLPSTHFLAGDAVMIIQHGIDLAGILVDNSGKPVPQATITRDHQWRNRGAILQSDEAGRFKISNLRPGDMVLTVQAQGLEPQTVAVVITNQMPELRLALNPGKILKGRVLDDTGKPVAGATIQMDRDDFQPLEFDWRATTDKDGRFVWDSAPAGSHPYLITADGFNLRSLPALAAEDGENTITLHSSPTAVFLDGKVTDLTTRAPIENFAMQVHFAPANPAPNGPPPPAGAKVAENWGPSENHAGGVYAMTVGKQSAAYHRGISRARLSSFHDGSEKPRRRRPVDEHPARKGCWPPARGPVHRA